MRPWMFLCCLAVTSTLLAAACSSDGNEAASERTSGSGGSSAAGTGGSSAGGSSSTSKGGSGGTASSTSSSGSGGGATTGGSGGSGGSAGSAGSAGKTGSGGSQATGGAASKGGTTGAGGLAGAGGSSRPGAGGSTGTGGVAGSGGALGSGGATGAGGSTSTSTLAKFSFFIVSYKAIQALSGSADGFGGDLRYGETGPGAGLKGADKICAAVAERSMAGSSSKQWRAFLSVTADENGKQVNAVDRIGPGPWYDRVGRVFALTKADLIGERPANIDAAIKYDLPNEDGVPNHNPDKTGNVDNHDMITGSNAQGQLYGATATCKDWTTSEGTSANGKPRVGHPWPTGGTSMCGRTGGGGGFPGGGDGSMCHWISALDEAGCAKGVNLKETGGPGNDGKIGSGGGYGGFYCFALTP